MLQFGLLLSSNLPVKREASEAALPKRGSLTVVRLCREQRPSMRGRPASPTRSPPRSRRSRQQGAFPRPELPSQASPLDSFPQGGQDMYDNCRDWGRSGWTCAYRMDWLLSGCECGLHWAAACSRHMLQHDIFCIDDVSHSLRQTHSCLKGSVSSSVVDHQTVASG